MKDSVLLVDDNPDISGDEFNEIIEECKLKFD